MERRLTVVVFDSSDQRINPRIRRYRGNRFIVGFLDFLPKVAYKLGIKHLGLQWGTENNSDQYSIFSVTGAAFLSCATTPTAAAALR